MSSTDIVQQQPRNAPIHNPKQRISGKVKAAIELMVWDGLGRDEAAQAAGLKPHSLYCAFRTPHVRRFYLAEFEVFRISGRAKRFHRLDELAMQDENKNAAVAAIKAAEQLDDEAPAINSRTAQIPGFIIVMPHDLARNESERIIDVNPKQAPAPELDETER
jgi:hypothetical protein